MSLRPPSPSWADGGLRPLFAWLRCRNRIKPQDGAGRRKGTAGGWWAAGQGRPAAGPGSTGLWLTATATRPVHLPAVGQAGQARGTGTRSAGEARHALGGSGLVGLAGVLGDGREGPGGPPLPAGGSGLGWGVLEGRGWGRGKWLPWKIQSQAFSWTSQRQSIWAGA